MPPKTAIGVLSVLLLCGCTVGPNYQRPKLATPAEFHAPESLPAQEAFSIADLKWFELFHDEQLQALIRRALVQNYDLRDAVTRVEAARANLGITRSNQVPKFCASGGVGSHGLRGGGAD